MKTIELNGKKLQMYDSIDELPIINFQKYNKYVLFDSGIGSDVNSIDEHLVKLAKLIKTDKAKASRELQNMRLNMHMVISEISPSNMAFVALIHSIDGKPLTDLSEDNIKHILETLSRGKHSKIIDFLQKFKKKLDSELLMYFPKMFDDTTGKNIFDKHMLKADMQLKHILEGANNVKDIEALDAYLFGLYKPKAFEGKESVEIRFDKQFETSCMLISQKANRDAKKMTVLEYYTVLENIQKQLDTESKAYNKKRV